MCNAYRNIPCASELDVAKSILSLGGKTWSADFDATLVAMLHFREDLQRQAAEAAYWRHATAPAFNELVRRMDVLIDDRMPRRWGRRPWRGMVSVLAVLLLIMIAVVI